MSLENAFIDRTTFDAASNSIYNVDIWINNPDPADKHVRGTLTNEVHLRMDAKWEPIFNTDNLYPDAQKLSSAMLNRGIANTGFWSQLYFKSGGYLTLTPEIRIVDFGSTISKEANAGDSPVLRAAGLLTAVCFPKDGPTGRLSSYSGKSTARGMLEAGTAALVEAAGAIGTAVMNGYGSLSKTTRDKSIGEDAAALANGALDANFGNIISTNPEPVEIHIGRFFAHPYMIIESIDCKFSKEQTRRGPLFVDIKLELKSLVRPSSHADYLQFPDQGTSRVEFLGSSEQDLGDRKGG